MPPKICSTSPVLEFRPPTMTSLVLPPGQTKYPGRQLGTGRSSCGSITDTRIRINGPFGPVPEVPASLAGVARRAYIPRTMFRLLCATLLAATTLSMAATNAAAMDASMALPGDPALTNLVSAEQALVDLTNA